MVLGVLVIEDLVVVFLLVILLMVFVFNNVKGSELLGVVFKFGFFLVFWFLWGIFFLFGIFRKFFKYLMDEMLFIIVLVLCFGMVILVFKVGFLVVLGVFVMGLIFVEIFFVYCIE